MYNFHRKKLLETVEFIKKCVTMPQIPQQSKTPQIQCQEEIVIDVQEKKEKQKILNNLPKVGVSCTINHHSIRLDSISDFLSLRIFYFFFLMNNIQYRISCSHRIFQIFM